MLAELLNVENRAFTLWRLKKAVFLVSIATFIFKNWGSNLAVAKFLWVSFIARQGDAPLNAFYVKVNEATLAVASGMAHLMVCALSVWIICYIIDLFLPAYLPDAELKANRAKAAEHYKQVSREAKGLEATQKIVTENLLLRSELSKLGEELQAVRVEASAIVLKRSKKKTKPDEAETDLFSDRATPASAPKSPKKLRITKRQRKRPAPEF